MLPGQTARRDESIGWDIVSNVSLFNDCVINEYPGNVQLGFQAPGVIRVILHMDEGSLRFKSGIDGTDYGHCLNGLRAFSRNGQKLYPAISMTKQGAEIGIKYLGSAGTYTFIMFCVCLFLKQGLRYDFVILVMVVNIFTH